MAIKRIHELNLTTFEVSMTDNDHVPPSPPEISSQRYYSSSDCAHRFLVGNPRTGRTNPILTEMSDDRESARFIVALRVGTPQWEVEPVRDASRGDV